MAYISQTFRLELQKAVKRHAHLLNGRILDVGAGSSDRYSQYFKSEEYVRLNLKAGPNTDLVGSAESVPAPDASFDGILCTQVLGDIFDPGRALAEFSRVLRNGGRVLLTESFMDPLHDEPRDYWRFTPHSLRRLFEEGGFSVEVLDRVGGYHSLRAQLRTRYYIEKLNLYEAWYARVASLLFKFLGSVAMWRDSRDKSGANKLFAHGFLIVARRN